MPLREYMILRQKAKMRKNHRFAKLIEFYIKRSQEAEHEGRAYMSELNVVSLGSMVRYNYPRLSELTIRRYAEELYSVLRKRANKSS